MIVTRTCRPAWPIDPEATYPLDRVSDAFSELERGHTRGEIVLIP